MSTVICFSNIFLFVEICASLFSPHLSNSKDNLMKPQRFILRTKNPFTKFQLMSVPVDDGAILF